MHIEVSPSSPPLLPPTSYLLPPPSSLLPPPSSLLPPPSSLLPPPSSLLPPPSSLLPPPSSSFLLSLNSFTLLVINIIIGIDFRCNDVMRHACNDLEYAVYPFPPPSPPSLSLLWVLKGCKTSTLGSRWTRLKWCSWRAAWRWSRTSTSSPSTVSGSVFRTHTSWCNIYSNNSSNNNNNREKSFTCSKFWFWFWFWF